MSVSEVAGAAVKRKEGRRNWTALRKLLANKLTCVRRDSLDPTTLRPPRSVGQLSIETKCPDPPARLCPVRDCRGSFLPIVKGSPSPAGIFSPARRCHSL